MGYNQQNKKAKFITKAFPFMPASEDKWGNKYNADSCIEIMKKLQESGCFDMLNVTVSIARSAVLDGDAKGMMVFGRILNYIPEEFKVELIFTGKNIDTINKLTEDGNDIYIIPYIRGSVKTGEITSILGFEAVIDDNE